MVLPDTSSCKKVILHSLSISYENPRRGIYDFDQNGIHFARRGDIVVTRNKISEAYLRFLSECGYNLSDVLFASTNSALPDTYEAFFDDTHLVESVKNVCCAMGDPKTILLDNFMVTSKEVEWARKVGVSVISSPEQYYEFGTKSSFRTLARQNRVKIPEGYKNQSTVISAALSASLLFLLGADEIVVKSDEGVAGLGSRRFVKNDFLAQPNSFAHFIETHRGVIAARQPSFVIERWYSDTKYSPSIQLYISQDGQAEIVSTHIQLFYSNNSLRYRGCLSGNYLTDSERNKIEAEGVRFGAAYAAKGYRGHIAFNTILLHDGTLIFVETNPRRVMSSYPCQIRQVLYGNEASRIYYRSQHIQKDTWKGKSIEAVLSSLETALFSPKKKMGIVPFDYGLLFSTGRLSLVGFGSSKEEVSSLFKYVETI